MGTASGCFRFERTPTAPSAAGRGGRSHRKRLGVYYPHFHFASDTPPTYLAPRAKTRPPTDAAAPNEVYNVFRGAVSSRDG